MTNPTRSLGPALIALAALAAAMPALAAADDAQQRPNLLFIIADDCTYRDLGTYGGQAHTPHMDRLAEQGMRMTRCFQAAPMCSPTRHNIYTGLYPVKSGAYPNHTYLEQGTKSIVQYLEPLGYRMALSGKKHINPKWVLDFEFSGRRNPDMGAIDELFAETSESGEPFCLFACSNEPHTPWNKGDTSRYPPDDLELPPKWVDTPETREAYSKYLAEVTYFDGQVGRILEMLEKHGLSENTLVIVTSEQGSAFPFAKWTLYDAGIRTGMIARWPGKIEPGSVSDAMVEYVDVTPTFVDAAGGEPSDALDGESMLPVLLGERDEHKEYVYGIHTTNGIINAKDPYPVRSIRSERYKLILNLAPENMFRNACQRTDWFKSWVEAGKAGNARAERLVRKYQYRPAVELYDVTEDPYERNNLAGDPEYASVVSELKGKLKAWMRRQGDEGLQTEVAAKQHQWRHVPKQRKQELRQAYREQSRTGD